MPQAWVDAQVCPTQQFTVRVWHSGVSWELFGQEQCRPGTAEHQPCSVSFTEASKPLRSQKKVKSALTSHRAFLFAAQNQRKLSSPTVPATRHRKPTFVELPCFSLLIYHKNLHSAFQPTQHIPQGKPSKLSVTPARFSGLLLARGETSMSQAAC